MSDDLTYINENGDTVLTAQFHRNRKTCCKSSCLHCPYGTTLNKVGVKLEQITNENLKLAQEIVDDANGQTNSVANSLLDGAFGAKKNIKISDQISDFQLLSLKGFICGVAKIVDGNSVKEVFLKRHFREQGIDIGYIQSLIDF